MVHRTYKTQGIVLKRVNYGEADRIVTLFTREYGKITVIAKGVRKVTSSRASCVEPGTEAEFFIASGKSMDILTQTRLIKSHDETYRIFSKAIQTFQILEIIDNLTVEQEENSLVYEKVVEMLDRLDRGLSTKAYMLEQIRLILKALGFTYDKPFSETKLKEYIEELSQKRLKTKVYLSPPSRR